jgi:hypothetical protein
LIHELGHFALNGIFLPHLAKAPVGSSFSIDIDDCPCAECEDRRGAHILPFSTIEITIVVDGRQATQRLTTEEAGALADKLKEFAEFLSTLNEDIHKEENPLGDYA